MHLIPSLSAGKRDPHPLRNRDYYSRVSQELSISQFSTHPNTQCITNKDSMYRKGVSECSISMIVYSCLYFPRVTACLRDVSCEVTSVAACLQVEQEAEHALTELHLVSRNRGNVGSNLKIILLHNELEWNYLFQYSR